MRNNRAFLWSCMYMPKHTTQNTARHPSYSAYTSTYIPAWYPSCNSTSSYNFTYEDTWYLVIHPRQKNLYNIQTYQGYITILLNFRVGMMYLTIYGSHSLIWAFTTWRHPYIQKIYLHTNILFCKKPIYHQINLHTTKGN